MAALIDRAHIELRPIESISPNFSMAQAFSLCRRRARFTRHFMVLNANLRPLRKTILSS
jgi:hypothetical protein